jgi:hypothetical protein
MQVANIQAACKKYSAFYLHSDAIFRCVTIIAGPKCAEFLVRLEEPGTDTLEACCACDPWSSQPSKLIPVTVIDYVIVCAHTAGTL